MNITFEKVITKEQLEFLSHTANIVWHDAFKDILSLEQIEYMIDKFQSFSAFEKAIDQDNYQYYFVKNDDKVLGYIGLQIQKEKLFLSKLYLLRESRGKKIATKSFEFIEEFAKKNNLKSVWLTVNKYNYHAIEVYKHKGFIKIRDLVTDIGNGFVMDDYVFEKEIK